jgi:uncharacterized protein
VPEGLSPLFGSRQPILSYGKGGFRFANLVHKGSLLILPEGVFAWQEADPAALPPLLAGEGGELKRLGDFFLLGTGEAQLFPSPELADAFEALGLPLEIMNTGSACRTYNLLLNEQRMFSAGLIAF